MTKSKLKLKITTCELYDSQWNEVLSHTFYGNTENEISQLIEAHRKTDSFFNSSFKGIFEWKGGSIELKNVIHDLKHR